MVFKKQPRQDFITQGHYVKVKGRIKVIDVAHLHPPTNVPKSINFLYFLFSETHSRQDFIGQGHYSKVKSRSHHDAAHLHLITTVPTKYQLPTLYGS